MFKLFFPDIVKGNFGFSSLNQTFNIFFMGYGYNDGY